MAVSGNSCVRWWLFFGRVWIRGMVFQPPLWFSMKNCSKHAAWMGRPGGPPQKPILAVDPGTTW